MKKKFISTLPIEERRAAGHLFGLQNLGLDLNHDTIAKLIREQNWNSLEGQVYGYLCRNSESDEMFDDMMEEVESWIELMATDKRTHEMWIEEKAKAGKESK